MSHPGYDIFIIRTRKAYDGTRYDPYHEYLSYRKTARAAMQLIAKTREANPSIKLTVVRADGSSLSKSLDVLKGALQKAGILNNDGD